MLTKKESKPAAPPNNISININFNVKDNKPLVGKKIVDNCVQVLHNQHPTRLMPRQLDRRGQAELTEEEGTLAHLIHFTDCVFLEDRLGPLHQVDNFLRPAIPSQDSINNNHLPRKNRSAKTSRAHNEPIPSSFSTTRLKQKNYSKDLKDMFAKQKKTPQQLIANNHNYTGSNAATTPTPQKTSRISKIDRARIKSTDKLPTRKILINQAGTNSPERGRQAQKNMSASLQNLRRVRRYDDNNYNPNTKTPSKSNESYSRSNSNHKRNTLRHTNHNNKKDVGLQEYEVLHYSKQQSQQKKQKKKKPKSYLQGEEVRGAKTSSKKPTNSSSTARLTSGKKQTQTLQTPASAGKTISSRPRAKSGKSTIVTIHNYEKQFERMREEGLRLLHQEPTRGTHNQVDPPSSSHKKRRKSTNLVEKYKLKDHQLLHPNFVRIENYWNGMSTAQDLRILNACATIIQKSFRGMISRRETLSHFEGIRRRMERVNDNIANRRQEFWGDNSKSIIRVGEEIDQTSSEPSLEQHQHHQNQHPIDQVQEINDNSRSDHRQGYDIEQHEGVNLQIDFTRFRGKHAESSQEEHHPNDLEEIQIQESRNSRQASQEEGEDQEQEDDSGPQGSEDVLKMIRQLESSGSADKKMLRQLRLIAENLKRKQQQTERILQENQALRKQSLGGHQQIKNQTSPLTTPKGQTRVFDSNNNLVSVVSQQRKEQPQQPEFNIRMPVKVLQKKKETVQQQLSPAKPEPIAAPANPSPSKLEMSQERRREIEQLKQSKFQIDSIMKKAAPKKAELMIEVQPIPNDPPKPSVSHGRSPKSPNGNSLMSPKYQELNFTQFYKQKQRMLNEKRQKKHQEIKAMEINKLISPRSSNKQLSELDLMIEKGLSKLKKSRKEYQEFNSVVKGLQGSRSREDLFGLGMHSDSEDDRSLIQGSNSNSLLKQQQTQQQQPQISTISIFEQDFDSAKLRELQNGAIEKNANQQRLDDLNQDILVFLDEAGKQNRQQQQRQEVEAQDQNMQGTEQDDEEEDSQAKPATEPEGEGFTTNLTFVKEYCIGICEYIRSKTELKQAFKTNICSPLTYPLDEFLKSYRWTLAGEYSSEYNSLKKQIKYNYFKQEHKSLVAIPNEIFDDFNQTFGKLKRFDIDASPELAELEQSHLRAIVDVLNEALNHQRPCGIYGKPEPWTAASKFLKNVNSHFQEQDPQKPTEYSQEDQKYDQIFGIAIAQVIKWGSSLCGFIPEALELEHGQKMQIDEEYINHIKETRMALMLEATLAETEQNMLDFTPEETEVKLATSQQIFDILIGEVQQELRQLLGIAEPGSGFQYL